MSISVVIPCYNASAFIREAVSSVRSQSTPVREIIVVDDCSTDDSAAIARHLGTVVLHTPGNSGAGIARNIGIAHATGDVVAFLDADDRWHDTHCATVGGLLATFPDAIAAFGAVHVDPALVTPTSPGWDVPVRATPGHPQWLFEQLLMRNVVPQSSVMVRRSALTESGGYCADVRYAEDYDLWLRLARLGPFVCTDAVTITYRLHAAQATRNFARYAAGSWIARQRAVAALGGTPPPGGTGASISSILGAALEADIRQAWYDDEDDTLRCLLGLAGTVPGGRDVARRWEIRRKIFWRPRLLARRLQRSLLSKKWR